MELAEFKRGKTREEIVGDNLGGKEYKLQKLDAEISVIEVLIEEQKKIQQDLTSKELIINTEIIASQKTVNKLMLEKSKKITTKNIVSKKYSTFEGCYKKSADVYFKVEYNNPIPTNDDRFDIPKFKVTYVTLSEHTRSIKTEMIGLNALKSMTISRVAKSRVFEQEYNAIFRTIKEELLNNDVNNEAIIPKKALKN